MEGFTTELQTSLDSKNGDAQCTALDFDCCEKMELDLANFDDLCLGKGDLPSDIDIDPQILSDFSLENRGNMDLFNVDNCDLLEKDLAKEEALLLAEVSQVEKEQLNANIPAITNSHLCKFSDFNKKKDVSSDNKSSNRSESVKIASENAQGKRKVKVDWTPDLHRRFVQAVEQLGVDKAVPSRILKLMRVNCLTRYNIASHLQKYRSRRKHLFAYSPMQPAPPLRPLHVWGHPTLDHSMVHMWQKQPLPAAPAAWPAGDGSFWQHQPPRLPMAPVIGVPHFNPPVFNGKHYRPEDTNSAIHPVNINVVAQLKPATLHPLKERVDAAIDEVLSNPWAPLPIGLKAPSLESVMTELQKKGISIVPLAR